MATPPETSAMAVAQPNELQVILSQIDAKTKEIRQLEIELQEKDMEVRRAQEEQALIQELATINQLTLRKTNVEARPNKMRISDDRVEQILQLESRIKRADKESKDLEAVGRAAQQQTDAIFAEITEKQHAIETIKDVTGWERYHYDARGYINQSDRLKTLQKVIAGLEEKRNTLKNVTSSLTKEIEQLTQQMESTRDYDEEITKAKAILLEKKSRYNALEGDKKSTKRINERKRQVNNKTYDDAKLIKQLEGDKRALHTDLMKCIDAAKSNEKSILAQDYRMRQLEGRLEAIISYVALELNDSDRPEYRAPFDPEAASVPLPSFDEVMRDLVRSRKLVDSYDDALLDLDGRVELYIRNLSILDGSIRCKTFSTEKDKADSEGTRQVWLQQIEMLKSDFEQQYAVLSEENNTIRERLQAVYQIDAGNGEEPPQQ